MRDNCFCLSNNIMSWSSRACVSGNVLRRRNSCARHIYRWDMKESVSFIFDLIFFFKKQITYVPDQFMFGKTDIMFHCN